MSKELDEEVKDPAMLLYTADFIIGCIGLNNEERGQYITLMCVQHQKRRHLTMKEMVSAVGEVAPDVLNKFEKDEAGLYYNKRAEIETKKRAKYTGSRRRNLKGGKGNEDETPQPDEHMEPHMEDESEDVNVNLDNPDLTPPPPPPTPPKKSDPYINDDKSFYENEYYKTFGKKPYISNSECTKLFEITNNCADFRVKLPELLSKLKRLNFEDIGQKPDSSWLLNANKDNFSALYNGRYDEKVKITETEKNRESVNKEVEKEKQHKKMASKIEDKIMAINFIVKVFMPFIKSYNLTDKQIKDSSEIWRLDWIMDLVEKFNITTEEFIKTYREKG